MEIHKIISGGIKMKINKFLISLIIIVLFVQLVYAADTIVKPGNFTITGDINATNRLQGNIVCINNDCRTVWPSTTDTNESTRVGNLALTDCPTGKLVIGVQDNGTVLCATSQDTQKSASGIYLFNDSTTIKFNDTRLNTSTDNLIFGQVKLNNTIDNRAGDIKSVQGNDKFIINGSSTGDIFLILNTTHTQNNLNVNSSNFWDNLNTPSDISGSQFWYNHTNTAIRESDKRYLNLSGSNANSNINIGIFNLTANRIFGVQWTDITNKFIETVSSIYLFMDGTTLKFNDTKLNSTIDNRASGFNETNYVNQNFIAKSNETNLNVNKSNYWDNIDTINQVRLDDLNDVNVSNATNGKLLIFDGKNWTAGSVSFVDTNESTRFGNLALTDCPNGQIVQSVQDNGTILCVSDLDTDTTNNLTIDQRINLSVLDALSDVIISNATVGNLLSFNNGNWTAISRIIDTDTNESIRVSNIVLTDCASNQKVLGLQDNGTVLCATDQDTITLDGSLNSSAWNKTRFGTFLNTLNSSVGIGISTPTAPLHINYSDSSIRVLLRLENAQVSNFSMMEFRDNGTKPWRVGKTPTNEFVIEDRNASLAGWNNDVYPFIIEQGAAHQTLVLDSNNRVGVGTASPTRALDVYAQTTTFVANFQNDEGDIGDGLEIQIGPNTNPTTSNDYVFFRDGDGTGAGSIDGDGTGGVRYNVASDIRFKSNIQNITGVTSNLTKLDVIRYTGANGTIETFGLSAQQVQQYFPEVVSVLDEDDPEGRLGIAYQKLIPIMIQTIKEQQGEIISLKGEMGSKNEK